MENIITIVKNFSGKLESKESEKHNDWNWMSFDEIKNL